MKLTNNELTLLVVALTFYINQPMEVNGLSLVEKKDLEQLGDKIHNYLLKGE